MGRLPAEMAEQGIALEACSETGDWLNGYFM